MKIYPPKMSNFLNTKITFLSQRTFLSILLCHIYQPVCLWLSGRNGEMNLYLSLPVDDIKPFMTWCQEKERIFNLSVQVYGYNSFRIWEAIWNSVTKLLYIKIKNTKTLTWVLVSPFGCYIGSFQTGKNKCDVECESETSHWTQMHREIVPLTAKHTQWTGQ